MIKKCSICGIEKDINNFYFRNKTQNIYRNDCKKCHYDARKKWAINNINKIRLYRNNWKSKNKDKIKFWDLHNPKKRIRIKLWRQNNPLKYKSHSKISTALLSGIIKKLPCKICGSTKNIHGHHFDYSKPLEVIWLCPKHHYEIHRKDNICQV